MKCPGCLRDVAAPHPKCLMRATAAERAAESAPAPTRSREEPSELRQAIARMRQVDRDRILRRLARDG